MYVSAAFCTDFSSLRVPLTMCLHAGLLLLNMVISVISEGLAQILEDDMKDEGAPRCVNVCMYICVMCPHLSPAMPSSDSGVPQHVRPYGARRSNISPLWRSSFCL